MNGDLHDIGKNLVVMMFEGAGFEVKDLGVEVDPTAFVKAAQEGAQEEFKCPSIGEIDGIWICQVSYMDLILG